MHYSTKYGILLGHMDEDQDLELEEETTGDEDLKAALGATTPWLSDDPVPAESDAPADTDKGAEDGDQDTGDDRGDTENADPGPDDETLRKVLSDARVQAQLRQLLERQTAEQIANAKAAWDAEQELARAREEEALLDDAEFGKLMRERAQQRTGPSVLAAEQAGFQRAQQEFFTMAVSSVWEEVGELKALPEAKRAELDPANPAFTTYGKYINAVIDTAATSRAETMAKKMAKELADAQVKDTLSKMRKTSPSPNTVSGPSKAPGPIINLEKMSGDDLLKAAFA